jgi:dipeptidyl-peptidase 8
MGHRDQNEQGYYLGSVAMQVEKFPLRTKLFTPLTWGLGWECSLWTHQYIAEVLVKAGKPYDLQIYSQESDSIRVPESEEHY